jgi:GST-like protein
MLTLYGTKGSGSAAVEAALRLAGQPFQLVDAASWVPTPGLEKLKRVNPLVQVPTLVLDDGTVMTESAAILIWAGLRYPQSGLLPAEPAQAIRGIVYIAANCYAAIGIIDYPPRFCADCDEATVERIRAGTRSRLHEYWRIFADEFGAHMNAARPGALDVLAAVVSRWSAARAHLAAERPALHEMLERVVVEPRSADIFRRHWPPTA